MTTDYAQKFRGVCRSRAMFFFFFSPEKFDALAREHDAAYSATAVASADHRLNRRKVLLTVFWHSFFWVLFTLVSAQLTVFLVLTYLPTPPPLFTRTLQAVGAAVLLWAGLWGISPDIRSFGGETLVERVHGWIFRLMFCVATYILFLSSLL